MLDVGQANELKLAFRRANYTNDDIKRLCEGTILADVRNVLIGCAEINMKQSTYTLVTCPNCKKTTGIVPWDHDRSRWCCVGGCGEIFPKP
jgi:ribosomal protein S27E